MPKTPVTSRYAIVGERIIVCPRCGVQAQQEWSWVILSDDEYATSAEVFFDEAANDREFDEESLSYSASEWRAAHCQGCDQKTLWRNGTNVYPQSASAPAPHPDMSASAAQLYEEARQVLPLSRRAGAALARAALETQLRILDPGAPKGARLDDIIGRVAARVSTPLSERLDIIRHVGNKSLHDSGGQDDLVYLYLGDSDGADEIAELLFDAMNDLVDELITRPARTSDFWSKLPDSVRDSIQRKRAE